MLEILLIRHGETDYNKSGMFAGSTDIGLNETGMTQALRLGERLKDETIYNIYSSDLKRCVETGKHVESNIIFSENLREMNFGCWEGLTYNEIKEKYPDDLKMWESDWSGYVIPEGESFNQMSRRLLKEFGQIIKVNKGSVDKVAVISHSGCIRSILGHHIIGSVKESWRFRIENATVSRLYIINDYMFLKSLNER